MGLQLHLLLGHEIDLLVQHADFIEASVEFQLDIRVWHVRDVVLVACLGSPSS